MNGRGRLALAVLVAALGSLVVAGCGAATAEPDAAASSSTSQAPARDLPSANPSPDGAPLVSAGPDDGGDGADDGDQDDHGDSGGNEDADRGGTSSLTAPSPMPGWMTPPDPDDGLCPAATVRVDGADELQAALDEAGPGTVIALEPGVYEGEFATTGSGTAERPAYLCGPRDAVLDADDQRGGYVLHLDGAQHWVLSGFTVRNGQKGVMADGTTGTTISGLQVYGIGDEAIHLRRHSTDNLVVANTVSDTGRRKPKYGEGVYVGTATSNWCDITDCEPDRSDRNRVVGNVIYATTSEAVDLKEGTAGGLVERNQFDGGGLVEADSWLDAKGNEWRITANEGRRSPLDGFQTHDVEDGWGTRNVFADNTGVLDDDEGLLVALRPANQNVVECSNRVTGGTGELSNVDCR